MAAAVLPVDLDAAAHHDKPKHFVAGDGVAATGEAVVDFLQALADEQDVVLARRLGDGLLGIRGWCCGRLNPNELVLLHREAAEAVEVEIAARDAEEERVWAVVL